MLIMKKIYTRFQSKAFALSFTLSLVTAAAFSQPICGNIVENFNNTGGGTAGFTGDLTYNTSGYLQKVRPIASALYSVTTPTFQLSNTTTSIGFGFLLGGTERIARVEAAIIYTSTLSGELTTIFLGQFVPSYDATTPPTADVCRAVALSDLPGFPTGGRYRLLFYLTPNTGNGQTTQNITFDDYRTNGALSPIPLPVSFVDFEAKKTAAGALLSWTVAGEENVSRYEVERSTDGRTYSSVATVATAKSTRYSYVDAAAGTTAYYRIKNVDKDGKFKYSSIARIANGASSIVVMAFPQPVVSKLTVQHPIIRNTNSLLTISTADGRLVNSVKPLAGSMQTFVDMSRLQKGLYLVRFTDGEGATETLKVIKQ